MGLKPHRLPAWRSGSIKRNHWQMSGWIQGFHGRICHRSVSGGEETLLFNQRRPGGQIPQALRFLRPEGLFLRCYKPDYAWIALEQSKIKKRAARSAARKYYFLFFLLFLLVTYMMPAILRASPKKINNKLKKSTRISSIIENQYPTGIIINEGRTKNNN